MATPLKRYKCACWPQYRIRDLKFEDGILEVFNQKDVNLVENADGFGVQIVEIPLEEEAVPIQTEVARQGTKATAVTEAQEAEGDVNEAVSPEDVFEDEVKILGGGYYEYQGVKVRGKKNLPAEAQALL